MSSLSVLVLLLWTILSLLVSRFLFTAWAVEKVSRLQPCLAKEVARAYGMKFRLIELLFFSVLICGVPAIVYWGAGESKVSMEFSPYWTPLLLVGTSILIVVPKVLAWMEKMDWALMMSRLSRSDGVLTGIRRDEKSSVVTLTFNGGGQRVFLVDDECQKTSLDQPVGHMFGKWVAVFYQRWHDTLPEEDPEAPVRIEYMTLE